MKKRHNRGAGMIVIHEDTGKILILHKKRYHHWEYAKGGIEKGETELITAKRELLEEVNIKNISVVRGFRENIKYNFKAKDGHIFRTITYFLGYTSERVTLSKEHDKYRWCTFDQAGRLLKHRNYKTLLEKARSYHNIKTKK